MTGTAGDEPSPSAQPDESRHRVRAAFVSLTLTASVVATVAMSIVVVCWLLRIETTELVTLQTFITYFLLPAYFVLGFAYITRRRALGALSALLILAHVFLVFPEFAPAKSLPDDVGDMQQVTLYNHNILFDNKTPAVVGDAIERRDADFVFLQEFSQRDLAVLRKTPAFARYPYKFMVPSGGPEGIAIWSKHPLRDTETVSSPGFPSLRAIADVDGKPLVLWSVHIHAPIGGSDEVGMWRADLDTLQTRLHAETENVLVGGDFNSTWTHRRYRDLLQHGYTDAHVQRGRGNARTWPVSWQPGIAFSGLIRIDHVITSRDVLVTHIEEDPGSGSDHRALYVKATIRN